MASTSHCALTEASDTLMSKACLVAAATILCAHLRETKQYVRLFKGGKVLVAVGKGITEEFAEELWNEDTWCV